MPPISFYGHSRRVRMYLEELEPRRLLSWVPATDLEQVFLERLNDARANPAAYGASIGLNLAGVAPAPPLALNPLLTGSARLHSQDMNDRRFFDHTNPDGLIPLDRMRHSGFFPMSWAESIAGGYSRPDDALKGLILDAGTPDLGHRRQLLAMDPAFQTLNQTGIGIVFGTGPYGSYYTIDSGATADSRPLLTGVVFRDSNGNGRYDAGEGIGNVTITVSGSGSTTTLSSGGYSIPVNPGTYTVIASGPGLSAPLLQTVTVGLANYRLNFDLANPPNHPPPNNPPAPVSPATTVNDAAGRPMLFVLGLDDQVYAQKMDANGNAAGGYFLAAVGQVKSFTVGCDGLGNPEVFAIGLNDMVFSIKFSATDDPIGNYNFTTTWNQAKVVKASHDAFGLPELFVIGLDNQVYALKFDANGDASGNYFLTAGGQVKSFAIGSAGQGQPEIFVIGLNDMVYAQQLDANGYPSSGYFLASWGAVKSMAVGHDAQGAPELFVIGLDDRVYLHKFDAAGNPLGEYAATCDFAVKSIQISYDAFNRPELFATGLDDQVYAQLFSDDGFALGACWLTRPGQVKSITAGQDAAGRPELFVIGLDDQVYAQKFDDAGASASNYFLSADGRVK